MRSQKTDLQISASMAKVRRGLVLRANSVLITVYGDAIAPRQQAVWLGSLIELLAPFGLSARLVRTSAFRLAADGWFTATRIGRRSYYRLSDVGLMRVQHADRRIYEFNLPAWDGRWTLVLLDANMRASTRQHLKRELMWESFGQLAPNVFAHPHVDHRSLQEIITAAQAKDQVAVLNAQGIATDSGAALQTIMHDTFKLTQVERAWQQFITRFEPVGAELGNLNDAEAFFARTLLIHEYRRVLLRDPNLPEAFLPADWPGVRARQLCEALYRALLPGSEQFLCSQVQTPDGPLARAPRAMARRLLRL